MSASHQPVPLQQVGSHRVEHEGDDLLVLRLGGDVLAEDAAQLVRLDREQAARNGYSLVLIDGRSSAGFGSGARQAAFDEMKRHPGYIGSTAMFGVPGPLALVTKLILRAVALLGLHFDDEVQMFATEPE